MNEARLLGYDQQGNYRLYDVQNKRVVLTRHVIFNEMQPRELPNPSYDLDASRYPIIEHLKD